MDTKILRFPYNRSFTLAIVFPNQMELKSYLITCTLKGIAVSDISIGFKSQDKVSIHNFFNVCDVVIDEKRGRFQAPKYKVTTALIEPIQVYNPHILYYVSVKNPSDSYLLWGMKLREEALLNHLTCVYYYIREKPDSSHSCATSSTINLTPYKGRKYYYTDKQDVTYMTSNMYGLLGNLGDIANFIFKPCLSNIRPEVTIDQPVYEFLETTKDQPVYKFLGVTD